MAEPSPQRPVDILLVEDDLADVRLIEKAMSESRFAHRMHVMRTGEEAYSFLFRTGDHRNAPRPDLIFLDLYLPGMNGRELLAELKRHESLRRIPVVVLSASSSADDIIESYDLHANCYIPKPTSMSGFAEVLKAVEEFWFTVVKLPPA